MASFRFIDGYPPEVGRIPSVEYADLVQRLEEDVGSMADETTGGGLIASLIESGDLIPVLVFGSCGHPERGTTCEDPEHWSFGLCDEFTVHSPAGSGCNRAEGFIFRPSDAAMGDRAVSAAIARVRVLGR